jgi:hypothetical protein
MGWGMIFQNILQYGVNGSANFLISLHKSGRDPNNIKAG